MRNISKYTKIDIDQGLTPYDVYKLCSCIRETFCLSYSIRKFNNLYIYIHILKALIKFEGVKLRYLGPDERSQALLLKKALIRISEINSFEIDKWLKSTPGILIRKFNTDKSFINYIFSIIKEKNTFLIDELNNLKKNFDILSLNTKKIGFMDDFFFIIPQSKIPSNLHKIIEKFKEMKNIKIISLSKIKGVENKILYINFRRDQLKIFN